MRRKPATIPFESLWPICEAARACHEALERLEVLAAQGMKRGEQTSPEVASIAGKWLAKDLEFERACDQDGNRIGRTKYVMISEGEWAEIKRVLASAASQAADKPKAKRRRRP